MCLKSKLHVLYYVYAYSITSMQEHIIKQSGCSMILFDPSHSIAELK